MSNTNNIDPAAAIRAAQVAQQRQQKQQINAMLEASSDTTCEKCTSTAFAQVWFIKTVSAIASPSGEEMTIPVQSFRCADCGNVNDEFTVENVLEK